MTQRALVLVAGVVALATAWIAVYRPGRLAPDWASDCPWTSTQFEWDYRNLIHDEMTLREVETALGLGKRGVNGFSTHVGTYKDGSGRWKHIVVEGDTEFVEWTKESPWRGCTMTILVGFMDGKVVHKWFRIHHW